MVKERCVRAGCREQAHIGLNGVWLCIRHYEQALEKLAAQRARLLALLRGRTDRHDQAGGGDD